MHTFLSGVEHRIRSTLNSLKSNKLPYSHLNDETYPLSDITPQLDDFMDKAEDRGPSQFSEQPSQFVENRNFVNTHQPLSPIHNSTRSQKHSQEFPGDVGSRRSSDSSDTNQYIPGQPRSLKQQEPFQESTATKARSRGLRPKLERRDTTWTNRDFPGNLISEWQAGWNVTNAIQGMFIVSLPYAVRFGGYWALLAMVGIAQICCYTGNCLVDCLYEEREEIKTHIATNYHGKTYLKEEKVLIKVRVRDSYVSIAQSVWGDRWGSIAVNAAQIIELLMTCILYIVLCGDLMYGSFSHGAFSAMVWMVFSVILLLPCAFLKTLTGVSRLSFACTMAHIVINVIVILYCVSKIKYWHWSSVPFKIDIWHFPISLGVIVFSYTSHIFLPALEGNLEDRSKFRRMLKWSHIAAALFKSVFGYVGYLTFGDQTQEVITNNFQQDTAFKALVNIILVIKALFSYPLPYFAAAELIETAAFRGQPQTRFAVCLDPDTAQFKPWALGLRLVLILTTLAMAVMIPYFNILMGLIGSFTGTLLSFVWPCYFHLKIKGKVMAPRYFYIDIAIILIGSIFGLVGIFYSSHALITAMKSGHH